MLSLRTMPNWLVLTTAVFGALLFIPGAAEATNAGNDDRLVREAADLERKGDWRGAAEAYWKALGNNRQSADLRQKYLHCLRRIRLADRHADPTYRKRVQELALAKSLTAYVDALNKIQANYVDRTELATLFHHGLDELGLALNEPAFRQGLMPDADGEAVLSFLGRARESWDNPSFRQVEDVRLAVKQIALAAQKDLGVKPSFIVMEFVCGACNSLDERTAFIPPSEEYTTYVGQLNALGLLIASAADNMLLVEKVAPGSWAAQMGVKDGDRIVVPPPRKDEKDELEPLVEIKVRSSGEMRPRTVKLPDSLPSVLDEEVLFGGVGYLRIASFQKNTIPELDRVLVKLQMRGMRALIVDLRGNPGGLFPVSVQVAERFLPEGIIVMTQGQVPAFNRTFESHSGMAAFDLPLYVLIDGDTASAAEVLAGALKDNGRAQLIGQPTFGKGTIQTVLQLTDGGGVRITLARFFTPRGQPYNGVGVAPNQLELMRPREVAAEQARGLLSMRP